jgi:cysteine desulfurase/selenocysteine lyase
MALTPTAGPRQSSVLDVAAIRADFPSLPDDFGFFDSVASSLTPRQVVAAMNEFYEGFRANVHRGSYDLSIRASDRFDSALGSIARFIGARDDEVVLTQNTTHSLNLVALSLPLEAGDEIVLSSLEHTSNMAPWMRRATLDDLGVRFYHAGHDGSFDLDEFAGLLTERTKVVTLTWISNITGTVVPVAEVGKLCKERGIIFVIDAAQAAPHVPIDVNEVGCDFLAFSGHKMLGPTGIGVLYVASQHGASLMPAMLGGGTIDTTVCAAPSLDGCVLSDCSFTGLPHKWQAGTPPIAEALGLEAAVHYLEGIGFDRLQQHETELVKALCDGLAAIDKVDIHGPQSAAERTAIVAFNVGDLPPDEVGRILNDRYQLGVRAGQHCAVNYFQPELSSGEGQAGNVRASVYLYNTLEEVHRLVDAVDEISAIA